MTEIKLRKKPMKNFLINTLATTTGILLAFSFLVAAAYFSPVKAEEVVRLNGGCTAFAVSANTFVSAGHCIRDVQDNTLNVNGRTLPADLIAYGDPLKSDIDFAILRTEDPVNETFLPLDCAVTPAVGTPLSMIGYPAALGKVSVLGRLASEPSVTGLWKTPVYRAHLPALPGNSGSPVVNETTGGVLGILVGGVTANMSLTFITPIAPVCEALDISTT